MPWRIVLQQVSSLALLHFQCTGESVLISRLMALILVSILCELRTRRVSRHVIDYSDPEPLFSFLRLSAIVITILETAFAVDLFLEVCIREERGCCLRLWRGIRWVDLWRKSILYAGVSSLCFWYPNNVWLAILAGEQNNEFACMHVQHDDILHRVSYCENFFVMGKQQGTLL